MRLGYYPGCSLEGTGKEYDESIRAICKAFKIQLEEIKEWNCCGATAAHSLNKVLSISLPARSLALAAQQGFTEILVPCAACYSRLMTANHEMKLDESIRKKVEDVLEMKFDSSLKIINIMEFLQKYILPEIKEVKRPFNVKTACYYGCLLVRPPEIVKQDRFEDPMIMDEIMKKIGAETIDWAFKTECCGAGLSVSRTDIVGKLSGKILKDALDRGAETIIVACPMCQSNLDLRRSSADAYLDKKTSVPVLFITQAIGLSMGLSEKELGIQRLMIPWNNSIIKPKKVQPAPATATKTTTKVEG